MNPLAALLQVTNDQPIEMTDSVRAAKSEPMPAPLPPENPQTPATPAPDTESTFYLRHITEAKTASENARRPHKDKWDICWDLFNNRYDFSDKAEWQSQNWVPKIPTIARGVTNLIKTSLKASQDVGTIDGYGELSKAKAPMMSKLVLFAMKKGKFIDKLVEAILGSMMTPGINLKIYPKASETNTADSVTGGAAEFSMGKGYRNMIAYEAINEYDLFRDPTGRNKYVIHSYDMDLADLKKQAENPDNGYDKAVVDSINQDFENQEQHYERLVRMGQTSGQQKPSWRKTVTIEEYWGEIYDQNGNIIHRWGTMSRANEKYLIRKPMANPFRHKKCPIISGFPTKVPFSVWHEAYVYAVAGLAIMITEVLNLALDSNLYDSLKVFQIDTDKIVDPTDLLGGLWPGKTIKAAETGGNPIIQAINTGGVSPQQSGIYSLLSSEINNGASTSEFAMPQLQTGQGKSGTTATEVMEKSSKSEMFTNALAQIIEEEVIEEAMLMTTELIIQYFNDFTNPEILDLLGTDAMILQSAGTNEERMFLLGGNYCFKSYAISGIVKRFETLRQMQILKDLVKEFPPLLAMINPSEIMKETVHAVGLDPKRFLVMPEDPRTKILEERMKQQISPLAGQLMTYREQMGAANPIQTAIDQPMTMPDQMSKSGMEALIA